MSHTLTFLGSSVKPDFFLGVSMQIILSIPRSMLPNKDPFFTADLHGVSMWRCILSSSVSTDPPPLKQLDANVSNIISISRLKITHDTNVNKETRGSAFVCVCVYL